MRCAAHLSLIDDAFFVLMHKFDGILNGDDMILAVRFASSIIAASVVDLPLPSVPSQGRVPRKRRKLCGHGGKAQPPGVRISLGISLKTAATPSLCWKKLDDTGKVWYLVREINIPRLFEFLDLMLGVIS
jgi:hypothetical protein